MYRDLFVHGKFSVRRAVQHACVLAVSVGGLVAAGPCDIYGSHGTPCIAAHSTTRALYAKYSERLYQVRRGSDQATTDILPISAGGVADSAHQDSFCALTTCLITVIYDQSGRGNHLTQAPAGGAARGPEPGGFDSLSSAVGAPVKLGGKKAYGVFISPSDGYRNNAAVGTASGDEPQGIYAVLDGTHYNAGCCFDYGNAERDNNDSGDGKMETIYFGDGGYKGSGSGPWIQADLENGLIPGPAEARNDGNPTISARFVTAMVKGKPKYFAIRGGDASSGALSTIYSGARPKKYETMYKQGAILLGIGGDNSNSGQGTFYEGAMTSGYPSDEAEAEVQADIVDKAKYAVAPLAGGPLLRAGSRVSLRATTPCCTTRYVAHSGAAVRTEVVSSSSSGQLKREASWVVRDGLGFSGCVSFESVDAPGSFVRLSPERRLAVHPDDGSKGFREEATFCPEAGLAGRGSSLRSWKYPTRYWRHFNNDMYGAGNGSPAYFDAHRVFNEDVTWEVGPGFA
ncbi:Alpha-N-arabinofuranosidase Precursor [Metarhizium album ARSEF 1941]|uniref:Alpha-L-arabinofuranosidase n=1 Tax=Metarhizium album (strain ARSEF 1941) TaxID=1081103 RepID=A0A0B2WIZ7_METAS|nr:Alpha-N-arabinofuranosidase Precursor [Metarhizium album ARSEF 1941]KHN93674.1 Alpha-N-arabinofuranosidase Precursor [Metarhizium album ARSEF 1941]